MTTQTSTPPARGGPPPMSERAFQQRILDYCAMRGLLVFHDQDSRRNQPGFPDLVIVGPHHVMTTDAPPAAQPAAPSPQARPDNLSPRPDGHGGTHGGTPKAPRGDTAVSPEPSRTREQPPQPPASGGSAPQLSITRTCTKPGPTPHPNCRPCGTTPRQVAAQERRDQADAKRRADQAATAAERAARITQAYRPDPDLLAVARQQFATTRRSHP